MEIASRMASCFVQVYSRSRRRPVLSAAMPSRCTRARSSRLTAPALAARHQDAVHLANEPEREGQATAPDAFDPVLERGDVAAHLAHVVERGAGGDVALVAQEVGEGDCVPSMALESTASLRTYI